MKKILKRFFAMSLALLMLLSMIPTAVQAEGNAEPTSEIVEDSGTIDDPELVDPIESSLMFDENYSGAVGEQVAISATFVCSEAPETFDWECSVENGVTFSQTSVMGPTETGQENTYWVSTMVTGVKEGNYTITLKVGAFASSATATTNFSVTEAVSSRYIVLILDASGSMSGTPADEQREAASNFCSSVLSAAGNNYISIVKLGSPASVGCEFTDNLDTLNNYISSFPANSGTNTNQALETAGNLLDNVTDTGKSVTKNIFICSDGLPEAGARTIDGPYTSSDSSYYRYANACYNTAKSLKNKGYTIYSLGFFHKLSGSQLAFGQRFMSDLANENCYYEVIDAADLDFTFGEVADDITVEPVSIDVSNVELISETDDASNYRITANITNNSKTTTLTNVFANIDEGENATLTEGDWKQTLDSLGANESTSFSWIISIDRKNHYNDGGVHYFIVYSGSDQTVTMSAQGSIALDSQNQRSNELDFSTDVWKFHNFSEDVVSTITTANGETEEILAAHKLTEDDKNALYSGAPASIRAFLEDWMSEGTNGHCFGMSLTTILEKMNIFNVSDYADVHDLREADLSDRIWSILCYYHTVQTFPSYSSVRQNFMTSYTTAEQLELLAERADAVKSGGCPVILDFGNEVDWGGHSVVAYALEPGSWKYHGRTYDHRILIYDCNAANGIGAPLLNPIWNEDCCLYFNEGTDEWEIPAYYPYITSTNPNAELWAACNDLDALNTHNYKDSMYNYIAELRCQNETAVRLENGGKQFVIMGKSGDISGDIELTTYCDTGDIDREGGINTRHILLPDDSKTSTITTLSGNAEELDFNLLYDDKYVGIEAAAAKGSEVNPAGKVSLSDSDGKYEITIADDTISSGDFNTYTITGDNEGDVTVEITEDGVIISGDNLNGAAIEASDDNITSTIEIKEDVSEVELSRDGDNLVAKGDNEDDGQQDTPVTPSDPDDADKSGSGSNTANKQSSSTAKTGDTQNVIIWVMPLTLMLLVIIVISVKMYQRRK